MKCRNRLAMLFGTALFLAGTIVPAGQMRSLRLRDGTEVTVIAVLGRGEAHRFQYLPANLSVARHLNGPPEFSFLPFRKDETSAIDGAIMHILIQWGLTRGQEKELADLLRAEVDSHGILDGPAPVQPGRSHNSWDITSTGPIGLALNRGVTSSGHVPTVPGNKMAVSFRFDSHDAKLMEEKLRGKRGLWGEKIRLFFAYGYGLRVPTGPGAADWVLETDLGILLPRGGN